MPADYRWQSERISIKLGPHNNGYEQNGISIPPDGGKLHKWYVTEESPKIDTIFKKYQYLEKSDILFHIKAFEIKYYHKEAIEFLR